MAIGNFSTFWIDGRHGPLYAALHMPETAVDENALGLLFVPPLMHEQPRSRRFITEAASEFSLLGMPVLRFDFFGSGDSSGEDSETDLSTMRDDVTCAVMALCEKAGVRRVALVAWRAGAFPAWSWLSEGGNAQLLLLWEPELHGSQWIDELEALDMCERVSPTRYTGRRPMDASANDGQLMGYSASPSFRSEVATIDIPGSDRYPKFPVWVVGRDDDAIAILSQARMFKVPDDAPQFSGSALMDLSLFMTPRMERLTREIGLALSEST